MSLFDTNDDLLELLEKTGTAHEIAAVFDVAALCDYKVKRVQDDQGRSCNSPKIASRSGALTISLEPATKVIAKMRHPFPESILVGWKYELAGTRGAALARAQKRIVDNQIDACVVNGAAFGSGFGFCQPSHPLHECGHKTDLDQFLAAWLRQSNCNFLIPSVRLSALSRLVELRCGWGSYEPSRSLSN